MSKGKQNFRRSETARLIRAIRESGLEVRKITADSGGKIEFETGPPIAPTEWSPPSVEKWQDWSDNDKSSA